MDTENFKIIISLIELVLFAIGAVYAWWNTRTRATQVQFSQINSHLSGLGTRVSMVEHDLSGSPGHKEIGEVHNRVDQIGQAVTGIQGEMRQMNNALTLIQQHLLDKKI